MDDLKIGIVGMGWAAGAHLEAYRAVKGAKVAAVCSRRPQDRAELERRCGGPVAVYTDYARMLEDRSLDVIDICTPPSLHVEQAIAAARAGKHLVLEKPIGLSWPEVQRVHQAIQQERVRSCVCFEVRFSAQFTLAKSVVQQGLLGEVHYGEVDYYHGLGPWYAQFAWNVSKDSGGSSLLSAGCHALDALLWLMDEPVEEVTSYSTRSKSQVFAPYEYDTTSTTILRFRSGRLGKVTSSIDCLQPYYFHCHLVGSEGSLMDDRLHSQKLPGMDPKNWSRLAMQMVDSGDVKDHPYLPQLQAFVDATRADQEMPLTSFESAFETHRVLFAADRSAAERRPVRLAELR